MSYPISLPQKSEQPLVTITHPTESIWEIEMHNTAENWLTHDMIVNGLQKAFDVIEGIWRSKRGQPGAVVITGKKDQNKFFCNGLDYKSALKEEGFFHNIFDQLFKRMITYPLPIIGAVNGHAIAAGFFLMFGCDYRVMTSGKAMCTLSEIHFGAPYPPALCELMKVKLSHPALLKTALEGYRWSPKELLENGFLSALSDSPDSGTEGVLKKAYELAEKKAPLAKTGVYGLLKKDVYRSVVDLCNQDIRMVTVPEMGMLFADRARL